MASRSAAVNRSVPGWATRAPERSASPGGSAGHRRRRRGGQPIPEALLGACCGPAAAKFRQGQIWGELAAAIPDDPAVLGCLARQADRVAGHFTRVDGAVALSHKHTRGLERGEELAF